METFESEIYEYDACGDEVWKEVAENDTLRTWADRKRLAKDWTAWRGQLRLNFTFTQIIILCEIHKITNENIHKRFIGKKHFHIPDRVR